MFGYKLKIAIEYGTCKDLDYSEKNQIKSKVINF